MSRFFSLLKKLTSTPVRRFFTCLLLGLCLFLAGCCLSTPTFYDNDDTNIAFALAGYLSGEPYPAHPFLNPILSAFVSFLYRILPWLPWWYLLQAAAVLISLAVVGACLFAIGEEKGLHPLLSLALFFGLALGSFYYPLFLATFTLTSACLGTAAVCLLLVPKKNDQSFTKGDLLSLVFLALAFLFRNSSGISLLCFYAGALVYRLARLAAKKANKSAILSLTALGACALGLSLCLVFINSWGRAHLHDPGFPEFDEGRSRFLDYPVDSYSENPELYAALGWDGPLYNLVKHWFYMDERVTTEALTAIQAGSKATPPRTPAAIFEELYRFFSLRPLAVYTALVPCLFLLGGLFRIRQEQNSRLPLLFALLMLLGGCALTLYLVLSGRIVLRAFQLIAIPTGASVLFLSLLALPKREEAAKKSLSLSRRLLGIPSLIFLGLALVLCCQLGRMTLRYDGTELLMESRALFAYVLEHPDTVFIRDTHVANNVDALTVYPDQKPVNLLDWGGTSAYTGAKQLQLERFDLLPFTAEVFFREDVRLITSPDSRDYKSFVSYLESRYPGADLRLETMITEQAAVYRVMPADQEALYGQNPA